MKKRRIFQHKLILFYYNHLIKWMFKTLKIAIRRSKSIRNLRRNICLRQKRIYFGNIKLFLYKSLCLKGTFQICSQVIKNNQNFAFFKLKETPPKLKEKDIIINNINHKLRNWTIQEKLLYLEEKKRNLEDCISKYKELNEFDQLTNDIRKEKIYLKKIIKNNLLEIEEIKLCL